jgi:hypothetical protein
MIRDSLIRMITFEFRPRRLSGTPIIVEKAVQLEKYFLARLFDLDEAEITKIDGLTFKLAPGKESWTVKDLFFERHKKKMQALAAALTSEDDLGKVVRGHIHIEHELQQILFFASPSPDHLKSFESQEFRKRSD